MGVADHRLANVRRGTPMQVGDGRRSAGSDGGIEPRLGCPWVPARGWFIRYLAGFSQRVGAGR